MYDVSVCVFDGDLAVIQLVLLTTLLHRASPLLELFSLKSIFCVS